MFICRTRPSSTSRRQAKLRPRTSSRQQPSRPPPSRARPKPMGRLEPRGAPPVGVYNTARTKGPPTRNLVLGPLGPPQALGCYSQSTRLVGFYRFYSRGKLLLLTQSSQEGILPTVLCVCLLPVCHSDPLMPKSVVKNTSMSHSVTLYLEHTL